MDDINKNGELKEELDELGKCKQEAQEYLDNWKRERADFINYKKEEMKRVSEFILLANESLLLDFLEIMDDLEIATKHTKDCEGLQVVLGKLFSMLIKYNVRKIEVEGKAFDPMFHEAVETLDPGGTNLQEVRAGYMIGDKVLRPARVKITK